MNVDDIKNETIPTDFTKLDMLDYMFERQKMLSEKYIPIEIKNGLRHTPDVPVNIDDKHGQAQLKDFFWRVTEELTEAIDAMDQHPGIPNHALEELADALHFLIETYILVGVTPKELYPYKVMNKSETFYMDKLKMIYHYQSNLPTSSTLILKVYNVIHNIGCASNYLKQRPWKVSQQLTDKKRFKVPLMLAFPNLIGVFSFLGVEPNQIFRIYWKKSEVNKFRIGSNY